MWITANRVTLARILLLPVPTYMLLTEGTTMRLGALALFSLIAATDYVDGMLARKYGATVLGGLLDPIADKMFLVMAYLPLAAIGWVAPWIVYVMFMREFVITTLRSVVAFHGLDVKTSMAAKYKTALQMFVAGYAIYMGTLPDAVYTLPAMAVFSTVAGLVLLRYAIRDGRRVDLRLVAIFGLSLGGMGVRLVWDTYTSVYVYMLLVLGSSVYSGVEYLWGTYRRFREAGRHRRISAFVKYVAEMVFVPAAVLSLCAWTIAGDRGGPSPLSIWVPILLLVLELSVGGLDNLLTSEGKERGLGWVLARSVVQLALTALLIAALEGLDPVTPYRDALTWALLVVTAVYAASSYIVHANTFLERRTAKVRAAGG